MKWIGDNYDVMSILQFSIQYAESLPLSLQLNTTDTTN